MPRQHPKLRDPSMNHFLDVNTLSDQEKIGFFAELLIKHYNAPVDFLKNKKRQSVYTMPRYVFFYLCCINKCCSDSKMQDYVKGKLDRTTIIHGRHIVEDYVNEFRKSGRRINAYLEKYDSIIL